MNTRFDKITTIAVIALLVTAVGLLVYAIFFQKDKDLQQLQQNIRQQQELNEALADLRDRVQKKVDAAAAPTASKQEQETETVKDETK